MSFPTPTIAHWRYLLTSSTESRSQYRIWTSWYRSLCNRFLDDTILEASSSHVLLPKFWCKQMPPNFGIKVILFQNYHVCTPDRSIVMGRESWSGAYYLSLSLPTYEPILQSFMRALLLHGRLDPSFQTDYKCMSDSGESNPTTQFCFSSCFLECPRLCQTLHGLIPCYEGLEWLEEFLCIWWLCRSF